MLEGLEKPEHRVILVTLNWVHRPRKVYPEKCIVFIMARESVFCGAGVTTC